MPDFMRRKLPQPRQRHLLHLRRNRFALFVGCKETFRNQKILPHSQRPERHVTLDDFARARINHRRAIRPPARRAVHPLNHVVPQVHQVRAFRQELHSKSVFVASGLKRLIPPPRAFEQRGANRLRRSAIQVVHDRLHRLADRRLRIFFLQPVPRDKALHDRFANRRGVIHVANAEKTRPRIVGARLVPRRRKLHERVMLAHRDRFGRRRHITDPPARFLSRKRECGLHFRI